MPTTPNQPTLPAEKAFTEAELNFIDESPPGLFAENQNSNIGAIRRTITDRITELQAQLLLLYQERFVDTSTQFLDDWERAVGLPANPTGLTISQRRARIKGRIQVGLFTRARRKALVENYVSQTFGPALQLFPAGLALSASGLQIFSGNNSLTGLYTITENITNFSYTVTIDNSTTVDAAALLRDLNAITPAGIAFNIVYSGLAQPTVFKKTGGAVAAGSGGGTKNPLVGAGRAIVVTWAEMETP